MSYRLEQETQQTFERYCLKNEQQLHWPVIFCLPFWIRTWWENLGPEGAELNLFSVWKGDQLLGLAPLVITKSGEAALAGSADVCDYLDFIVTSEREEEFCSALLGGLAERGINRLVLEAQRPEGVIFSGFFAAKDSRGSTWKGCWLQENQSSEISLPGKWEKYLDGLSKKQRHEVRRKLRKLERESGEFIYRVIGADGEVGDKAAAVNSFIPSFLDMFQENPDKDAFLTGKMERYFKGIIKAASDEGLARFGLLTIDGEEAAAVLYFDYLERIYLYNSGYRTTCCDLSAGLISKILCIRDSIERGKGVYDFLKGDEVYKSRLGGLSIPIYKVVLELH